jgi:hypothetical protein
MSETAEVVLADIRAELRDRPQGTAPPKSRSAEPIYPRSARIGGSASEESITYAEAREAA